MVHVSPHPLFGRKGDDLTLTVPVTFAEAALGAEVKVPTLDGAAVTLRLPAGHPQRPDASGSRAAACRSKAGAGDLLVTVEVAVPAAPDRRGREALPRATPRPRPRTRARSWSTGAPEVIEEDR